MWRRMDDKSLNVLFVWATWQRLCYPRSCDLGAPAMPFFWYFSSVLPFTCLFHLFLLHIQQSLLSCPLRNCSVIKLYSSSSSSSSSYPSTSSPPPPFSSFSSSPPSSSSSSFCSSSPPFRSSNSFAHAPLPCVPLVHSSHKSMSSLLSFYSTKNNNKQTNLEWKN